MPPVPPLTEEEQLALIHKETRLRLTIDYLNYNGVLYTQNLAPSISNSEKIDRSAA